MQQVNEHETRVKLIDNVLKKKQWTKLVKTEVSSKTHYQGVYKSGRMDYVLYDRYKISVKISEFSHYSLRIKQLD